MTCRIYSYFRMLLSRLTRKWRHRRCNNTPFVHYRWQYFAKKTLKRRRIVNFVIIYNVNKCAIYITLNSTISMKSCREWPTINHVQYKYTMCFRMFILGCTSFYILRIALSQNELFRSPRLEFGRPALSISFSDKRKSKKELKWQLFQTLFI